MRKLGAGIAFLVLILFVSGGCATTTYSPVVETPKASLVPPLRVGITPNYPPIIFKLNAEITGVEADMARHLARELGRPLEFIELPWEEQIPALMAGKTDIIMSGMTITEARKVRISFTDHYLKSGLVAAMRAENASKYTSVKNIKEDFPAMGVIKGTTGEAYVRANFDKAVRIAAFSDMSSALYDLKTRRIDLFVHDAPAIVWLVSENEGTLKGLWQLLNEEYLGWGMRTDDRELLVRVNAILNKWKNDGTLREVLSRWLPYWKNFD